MKQENKILNIKGECCDVSLQVNLWLLADRHILPRSRRIRYSKRYTWNYYSPLAEKLNQEQLEQLPDNVLELTPSHKDKAVKYAPLLEN